MDLATQTIRNLNTIEECNSVSTNRNRQALQQLNLVHNNDDGFITVAIKDADGKWKQYNYKKEDLESNIFKLLGLNMDTYMSINSFYVPKRSSECIRHINACYLDIDNHAKNKVNIDSVLYFFEEHFFNIEVPKPSLIIKTGRGLALYWLLENLPKQGLPLWTLVQEELYKKVKGIETYIKDIEVDPATLDVSRVFRIAGSKNTKSNTIAKIHSYSNQKYRLDKIIDGYLPELKIIREKKKKNIKLNNKQKKVVFLYTTYNLHYSRLMDIVKLQQIRNGKCNGQRELMCFLYRYYSCLYVKKHDVATQNTLEFNSKFSEPLSYTEVLKATKKAEEAYEEWLKNEPVMKNGKLYKRGGYNYTNKKLIELLKITLDEQEQLKTIISTEEKYKRNNKRRTKNRRNEEGLTQKQEELKELNKKVIELKENGFSYRDISKKLNISLAKVQRCVSKNSSIN